MPDHHCHQLDNEAPAAMPSMLDADRYRLRSRLRVPMLPSPGFAPDAGTAARRLRSGQSLYRAGDAFRSTFVVTYGVIKTVAINEFGRECVLDFHMENEFLGAEGIGDLRYRCTAIAMEDSEVLAIEGRQLPPADGASSPWLFIAMAAQLRRGQSLRLVLGRSSAEERLASFLVDFARRRQRSGQSAVRMELPMTRRDIAEHLGLAVETISRCMGTLQKLGLIHVQGRGVHILDMTELTALALGAGHAA